MNLAGWILRLAGWRVEVTVPDCPKCVICVAPHTSNWDFILGKLTYWSVRRKANFLMKEAWFVWPLGYLFRALGGIPVPRRRGSSLTEHLVKLMRERKQMNLAVTPEGTRSLTSKWRTGFLHIAYEAQVPVELGKIDYAKKLITITDTFIPSGDIEADLKAVKQYYVGATARYPQKFTTQ